ncbi:MAG: UDP-2,3-diacylglucosamine diphosphatase LpxI [Myxococcota bacterium]
MSGKVLGLVAGSGDLPVLVAQGARAQGYKVATAALMGETGEELRAASDVFEEVKIGQLGAILRVLQRAEATECVMVGGFSKKNLFRRAAPDLTTLKLVYRLGRQLQDDALLRGVAKVFEDKGILVMPVPPFIPDHMALPGVMTRLQPTEDEEKDVRYGMQVAKTTGGLDVGQTVVVRRGSVLAVEALEGTDAAIKRGAELGRGGTAGGRGGVVVCKVVKPHQDLRLDLPAVGPRTVQTCVDNGVRVLAVEAHRTIMVDRPKTVAMADRLGLVIVGADVKPHTTN